MSEKTWTKEEQAEHRRLWIEALRSGRYEQGVSALRDDDCFCCLGVACDLYRTAENGPDWEGYSYLGRDDVLPQTVQDWLGLRQDDGQYGRRKGSSSTLAVQNDDGMTFSEIAALIEAEPEGLLA